MNEHDRRNLLSMYMSTEPEISVNAETYLVSVNHDDPLHVNFFAVGKRSTHCAAIVRLTRTTWDQIKCGLQMAWIYNTVLDTLERCVVQSGGRLRAS
jgi:hypothetical protein